MSTDRTSNTYVIAVLGICVALICFGSWISIPIGPIPITLQMFVIPLIIFILPAKWSVAAVAIFLLLGLVGVPVFSGFKGGIGAFLGPTGGFLLGYIPGTVLAAILLTAINKKTESPTLRFLAEVESGMIFTLIAYAAGVIQYALITGIGFDAAFMVAAAPFIIPDIIKVILAAVCAGPISKVIKLS